MLSFASAKDHSSELALKEHSTDYTYEDQYTYHEEHYSVSVVKCILQHWSNLKKINLLMSSVDVSILDWA